MNNKDKKETKSVSQSSPWSALATASSAGFTVLASLAGGTWLGWKVDAILATSPVGLFAGGVIGGIVGFYLLYKQFTQY